MRGRKGREEKKNTNNQIIQRMATVPRDGRGKRAKETRCKRGKGASRSNRGNIEGGGPGKREEGGKYDREQKRKG